MSRQFWTETLRASAVDGPTVSGTAISSMLNGQDRPVLYGNYLNLGKAIRVRALGRISNIVTTPGTLTFTVRYGSTAIGVSQAIQLNTTAQTNVTFDLELVLTCRAEGAAGNFMMLGDFVSVSAGAAAAVGTVLIPASTPAVGGNADLTASNFIDLMATFSLTGNSLTVHEYVLEALN